MRRPGTPFGVHFKPGQPTLPLAMELSNQQWKLALTDRVLQARLREYRSLVR